MPKKLTNRLIAGDGITLDRASPDDCEVTISAEGEALGVEDSGTPVVASASLLNFGDNLVVTDDTGGAVTIDSLLTGIHSAIVGDGVETEFNIQHDLGGHVVVATYDLSGAVPIEIECTVELTDDDNTKITASPAPGTDELLVVIVGGVSEASGGGGGGSPSQPAPLFYAAATQSISPWPAAMQNVEWDTPTHDDEGWFDALDPGVFTPTKTGTYVVAVWAQAPQGVTADIIFGIRDNDAPATIWPTCRINTGDPWRWAAPLISAVLHLEEGVRYSVHGYYDSGTHSTDFQIGVTRVEVGGGGGGGGSSHIADHTTTDTTLVSTTETVVEAFAVDLPANRRVKIEMVGSVGASSGGTASDARAAFIRLRQGTTTAGDEILYAWESSMYANDAHRVSTFAATKYIDSGAGGLTDFVVTLQRTGGSNTVALRAGAEATVITFTDVGPQGA
jgi:hypothetical protein